MQFKTNFVALAGITLLAQSALAEVSPDYRLPLQVQPTSQSIELKLDPERTDYSGHVTIQLKVTKDGEKIGLHQVGLTLNSIKLSGSGQTRELHSVVGDYDINWLSDDKSVNAGSYQLDIDFQGNYSTDSLGMHRVTFEGNDYVFTQFEAMYARRAIPLFDEPSFKIPYQLTIVAPKGLTVISNNPVEKRIEEGEWQRVEFMQTPPLPSYLIAYAVGPLDHATIDAMSIPGNVYVPKGYANQLGFVTRETPKIVAALEDYFGLDYPYRKLDFVAVPEFAFGAMENPGLIAFRTDLLMVGDHVTGTAAERVVGVIAHEVAHIWYGDLVTMAWWDDIWLNESFATWMGQATIRRVYPEFESGLSLMRSGAFSLDQRATAKAIRRDVRTENEINQDGWLRYSKGQTILGMLEDYVGPEAWQKSIRQYIRKYSWSNATDKDLWRTVSEVSGINVTQMADDYLKQPGYALLTFDDKGKVSQQRYLPYGTKGADLDWRIPLTVKYKKDGEVKETFYLLDKKSGSLDLPSDVEWMYPDANARGYYRWQISSDQFQRLADDLDSLTNREKVAFLDNSEALLNSRKLALTDYLLVVDEMLDDSHPLVFSAALKELETIGNDLLDKDTVASFASYVDRRLLARFTAVGVIVKPDDTEAVVKLRPRLLRLLGQYGSSSSVIEAAQTVANQYLADPSSVDSSLGMEALIVTALHDDGDLYGGYINTYLESKSERQKSSILGSIYFRNPEVIKKFLDFSISSAVPAGDAARGIGSYATIIEDHRILYDWLAENFDALLAKIPQYQRPEMPRVMLGVCSPQNRKLLLEFFEAKGEIYAPSLATTLESLDQCIERKKRETVAFRTWLSEVGAQNE